MVAGETFKKIQSLLEELCELIHGCDRLTLWAEVIEVFVTTSARTFNVHNQKL